MTFTQPLQYSAVRLGEGTRSIRASPGGCAGLESGGARRGKSVDGRRRRGPERATRVLLCAACAELLLVTSRSEVAREALGESHCQRRHGTAASPEPAPRPCPSPSSPLAWHPRSFTECRKDHEWPQLGLLTGAPCLHWPPLGRRAKCADSSGSGALIVRSSTGRVASPSPSGARGRTLTSAVHPYTAGPEPWDHA